MKSPAVFLASAALVLAVALAYSNALRGPFLFDDEGAILENATLRELGSKNIFAPPPGTSVSGRPLVNASLAVNHALRRYDVRSYHAFNIAIHALASLALFGFLRRTLLHVGPTLVAAPSRLSPPSHAASTAPSPPAPSVSITLIAFSAALLWALHPLQTEAVTYVIGRTESLMGLCYFLTLYTFARGGRVLAIVACAAGMATKEVMVTAPLAVLLYDRVFVAGSWTEIRRQRSGFYAALAATWLALACCVVQAGDRAGTAGFAAGATWWEYALTQCGAILCYLRLALWPHPLVLDYGFYEPPAVSAIATAAVPLAILLTVLVSVCRRHPRLAFAALFFFLVLAPTSSVLPIATEPVAERRLYVPLASIAAVATCGAAFVLGRRGVIGIVAVAVALGAATWLRNRDYASARTMWTANVRVTPENARAHYSLARALADAGDLDGAAAHYRATLALRPSYVGARNNYAELLAKRGRAAEAEAEYLTALRFAPANFDAQCGLGSLRFEAGDFVAAVVHFVEALRLRPDSFAAESNLGCAYYELGEWAKAREHEEAAIRLKPEHAPAHYNLGNALNRQGDLAAARASYERALALDANYAEAHINLAGVLERTGDRAAAIAHYRAALRLVPDHAWSRQHLEALLSGR